MNQRLSRRLVGGALLAVSAAGAIVVWLHVAASPAPAARTGDANATVAAPRDRGAASTPLRRERPMTQTPAATPISQQMFDRFRASDNHRAFVRFAIEHPEQGGRFYASQVWMRCAGSDQLDARRFKITSPELLSEATARLEKAHAACSQLEEQFGGSQALVRLIVGPKGDSERDPVKTLERRMTAKADPEEMFQLATAQGDPMLLSFAVERYGAWLLALKDSDAMNDFTAALAHRAAVSIACEIGDYCVGGTVALQVCMQRDCGSIDLRQQAMEDLPPEDQQRLRDAITRMRAVLNV